MAEVTVTSLHKAFPDGTVAVEDLDLEIGDGELFVMLGPSGCGKTTTRRSGSATRSSAGCGRRSATSRWSSSSTRSTRT
jgi:ABC-type multidrug transport system ATPase subunit